MPELPEVETIRATLAPRWVGRGVVSVRVARADYIRNSAGRGLAVRLGRGQRVKDLVRQGKQLAVWFENGRTVLLTLGMSGQVFIVTRGTAPPCTDHIHVRWVLDDDATICFRDPRRFGGVWVYETLDDLHIDKWNARGPDALTVSTDSLRRNLAGSARAIKACLLDQQVLAGVGNIYADEALFVAGINPHTRARDLGCGEVRRMASAVRSVLRAAIKARGSTLRDYRDAEFQPGEQQTRFRVYGRGGETCQCCGMALETSQVAQRTTTHCPKCQPRRCD